MTLEDAYDELLAATPARWYVGRPMFHDERNEWQLYAFDPSERPVMGHRKREWTAIAPTEEGVVREMAHHPTMAYAVDLTAVLGRLPGADERLSASLVLVPTNERPDERAGIMIKGATLTILASSVELNR